ncbi:DUF7687 domain-containing protein [Planococcus shixiaomingii]|uniref:DUF7687 domain-containing protein n=1 Tax=Planococcus shixiaomingii TaxID=3058393 RepID=UPI0026131B2B|nr:hypothetical protein [Planococcus sp. N022]WKA53434.1 hypothetical protein QWY21_12265 [Planococcus sp. N022]
MKANPNYLNKSSSFWAYVKLISERLKYSKKGALLVHSKEEVIKKLTELDINIEEDVLEDALEYIEYRAELLTEHKDYLMDGKTASEAYNYLKNKFPVDTYTSTAPLNKQKGLMKQTAYLTAITNILTESTIRDFADRNGLEYGKDIGFNHDPRSLSYVLGEDRNLEGIFTRRFDGAIPDVNNAHLIWELKEYYYTTTFGSKISGAVYESQLDGHEAKRIKNEAGVFVKHVLIIDSYSVWWEQGASYFCRISDMLHEGLVDEVIIGKEVFGRWPEIVEETLEYYAENFIFV